MLIFKYLRHVRHWRPIVDMPAHSTDSVRHVLYTRIMQSHYLSVLISDRVMHPNISVSSINEHC